MSYSSVWMRAPLATAVSMIGRIVFCCTLASMRMTTCPPRWIRPRIGGLSFSSVPRPGAPASLRRLRAAPFRDSSWLALVASDHIDFVDLDLALQPRSRDFGDQAAAQLLRHDLHVRPRKAQFLADLPVREVQPHEIQAQNPDTQRDR